MDANGTARQRLGRTPVANSQSPGRLLIDLCQQTKQNLHSQIGDPLQGMAWILVSDPIL